MLLDYETTSPICKGASRPEALLALYASMFLTFHLARAISCGPQRAIPVRSEEVLLVMGVGCAGPYRTMVQPVIGFDWTCLMTMHIL